MENKKEPLMSAKDWIVRYSKPEMTISECCEAYAKYVLNNAKEFVADKTTLLENNLDIGCNLSIQKYDTYYCDTEIEVNKQSIHSAIDNYIEINLNKEL